MSSTVGSKKLGYFNQIQTFLIKKYLFYYENKVELV